MKISQYNRRTASRGVLCLFRCKTELRVWSSR